MNRFELHCHSFYSIGKKIPCHGVPSPEDVIKQAKRIGLHGVALTDHDSAKGWKRAREEAKKQGLIFIPAIEVSTKQGHIIALGLTEPVKSWRHVEETVDAVHEQGAIVIGDHPYDIHEDGIRDWVKITDAVEIFNALSLDRISNRIADKKAHEFGMPTVVGSDAHTIDTLGYAVNIMDAENVSQVLKAIKQDKVKFERKYIPVSSLVDWTRERFVNSYFEILDYVRKNYSRPKAWLCERLLDEFIRSRSRFWYKLGEFGVDCTKVYGRVKLFRYY